MSEQLTVEHRKHLKDWSKAASDLKEAENHLALVGKSGDQAKSDRANDAVAKARARKDSSTHRERAARSDLEQGLTDALDAFRAKPSDETRKSYRAAAHAMAEARRASRQAAIDAGEREAGVTVATKGRAKGADQ